jgi:hypothetical protein
MLTSYAEQISQHDTNGDMPIAKQYSSLTTRDRGTDHLVADKKTAESVLSERRTEVYRKQGAWWLLWRRWHAPWRGGRGRLESGLETETRFQVSVPFHTMLSVIRYK